MIKIPLSGKNGLGKFALIDDEDWDLVKDYRWHFNKGYAYTSKWDPITKKNINIFLHRMIMNAQLGQLIDHNNHNKLDNRRSNLSFCTHSQNSMNKLKQPDTSSQFKGVSWYKNKKKWLAQIFHYKKTYLGYFDNEILAAKAYNMAAKKLFGEFAKLNEILP
jgi:hypothetical protein